MIPIEIGYIGVYQFLVYSIPMSFYCMKHNLNYKNVQWWRTECGFCQGNRPVIDFSSFRWIFVGKSEIFCEICEYVSSADKYWNQMISYVAWG